METVIISGSNSFHLGKKLAGKFSTLIVKHFPDGEIYVRYPANIKGKRVVFVQSMFPNPNNAIIETILATKTARKLGAKEIILVAPYLAYMRQDKMFRKGECVSNKIIAELLSFSDKVIAVDPHLHRISSLSEIFKTKTITLSANEEIAKWIKKNEKNSIIVGPDIESYQWAKIIAEKIKHQAVILRKKRYSATNVRIKVAESIDFNGKNVIIIDDMISTGRTMIEPVLQLKKRGVKKITCICVHGLFVNNALELLKKLGVQVIATNSIESSASKIDISGIIKEAL